MSEDSVKLHIENSIATIELNEPGNRNSLTESINNGINESLDKIEESDAGVVIFEGNGNAFSAGGDVNRMINGLLGDVSLDERVKELEGGSDVILRVHRFPRPTIAKIDGAAVGAGANLAMACDIQVASEHAKFGFVFRNVGLGVDSGASYLLPRLVGLNKAKELIYTGEIIGPQQAADIGLVNYYYEDNFEEEVSELAETIASGPSIAFRHSKRLLNEGFEKSIHQAMREEAAAQGIMFQSDDHREGAEAFMEGRDPEFKGK